MGRIKLETLTDFARRGYDLRITCAACGHVANAKPLEMLAGLHQRRLSLRIEALEARMRCRACGKRQATIQAASVAE